MKAQLQTDNPGFHLSVCAICDSRHAPRTVFQSLNTCLRPGDGSAWWCSPLKKSLQMQLKVTHAWLIWLIT